MSLSALPKSILVTGANSGLGFHCCKLLAARTDVDTVWLGCRNLEKAETAKKTLEDLTGRPDGFFRIVLMDVGSADSVRQARLDDSIDGVVMNAGGMGGDPDKLTTDGVINIMAINLLGHVALLDRLLKESKTLLAAVYSGSEAVVMTKDLEDKLGTLADMKHILNGTSCGGFSAYPAAKLIGNLWMSSMARQFKGTRFVTISPGGTYGTAIASDLSLFLRPVVTAVTTIMKCLGMIHSPETGAMRYVDALFDVSMYNSGVFYCSAKGATGPVVDASTLCSFVGNNGYQDQANEALHSFLS